MKSVLGLRLACLLPRSNGWRKRPNIPIDDAAQRRIDTRGLLRALVATAIFSSAQIAMAQGPPINTDTPIMLGVQGRGVRTFVKIIRRDTLFGLGLPGGWASSQVDACSSESSRRVVASKSNTRAIRVATGVGVGPEGRIYTADFYNHRIQVFSSVCKFLGQFGEPGTGPGQLQHPTDVAIAADGSIYVVDFGNDRIQVFRQEG